jgi:hypothetical protein
VVEIRGARNLLGERGDVFYILPGHRVLMKPLEPSLVFRVKVPVVEN